MISYLRQPSTYGLLSEYPLANLQTIIISVILYNLFIEGFTRYMRNRPAMKLPRFTLIHNISLGLYSGFSALLLLHEAYYAGMFDSHDSLTCNTPITYSIVLIGYGFYLSKFWEYVDTALLIANKKPVIYLHRIHHSTTAFAVLITWEWHEDGVPFWFCPIISNLIVHFFMYLYFAYPRKLRPFRIIMTSAQLFQFIIVMFYCSYHIYMIIDGNYPCKKGHLLNISLAFGLYITYFVMFLNFFIQQYIKPNKCVEKEI
jgi:hypothetical protein